PKREEPARARSEPRHNPVWQTLATHHPAVQAKLAVGRPGDPAEAEADRVAEQVTREPSPAAQRGAVAPRPVQVHRRAASASRDTGTSAPAGLGRGLGAGRPLEPSVRAEMEPRFGEDFGHVRVHTGAAAAESAESLDALAYTAGRDVVFGERQYAPGTLEGRRLLAHELTHVVQQGRGGAGPGMLVQRKAKAVRFQDEPTLDKISEGKKKLKEGDVGEAVVRVTIALHELGHYLIDIIDEAFHPVLTAAVERYQTAKGLTGKVPVGVVEQKTFTELDSDFSTAFTVERDVLSKQKSPDLTKHTQSLDDQERKAVARAVSTEPQANPVTGKLPKFKPSIPGKGTYDARLRAIVDAEIVSQYNSMGKGKAADHADPTKLYDWAGIEGIAVESQKAVDSVFGEYTKGRAVAPAPLKHGVNIFDAWDDKVGQLAAGGKAKEDSSAEWRVEKILTGDDAVKALDAEHGAIQSRAAEALIVDKVKTDMVAKYRTELIETHKGWPGYASGGKIFIQVFQAATDAGKRKDMWDFYQTFIHEYIHTLEHPDHVAYRGGLGQQKGGFTLREGTTDYFTKIVWNSITIDDALRKTIEGPFHDPLIKTPIPGLNTYDESENAEKLAGVVGIRNVAAAFFLGKVDLIGKK
ncbi:MAG TPA: DUF4157 domain-containing protein, partial [Longimicrobiaceae bacterium]